jgi:hypothetical protein
MNFSAWLKANGYDEAALSDTMKKHLEAAWKAETQPPPKPTVLPPNPEIKPENKPTSFDAEMQRIESEAARLQHIDETTLRYCKLNVSNPEKINQLKRLAEAAKLDKNMSIKDFDIAMLHADRQIGMMVITPRAEEAVSNETVEAAICMTHRLGSVEKRFNERTLDMAHRRFSNGLTLNGLITMAARAAGYRGDIGGPGNLLAMIRHIKMTQQQAGTPYEFRADVGLSTISISGILSNVANKFLTDQFLYGEQSWRKVAKIKTANDFKQMSTYRLTGNNKFIKVPPGGELKHGTLSELKYINQVDTFGILLGIDRRDFINDDLGALTGRAGEVGQGAIDSLNEVFWTEWLDDSAFFPTDKSYANYGATDSVLSLAGLDNAENIFGSQTKPNGTPLGAMPRILLVPRALKNTALNLMAPAITAAAQSTPTVTVANVYQGRYDVVDSVYLQSSSIPGYSATAWYLLADPQNLAAIEAAFLFGRDTPTIEEAELDFERLGLSMRAYMDWGCKKQEYRAGVKLKGAA